MNFLIASAARIGLPSNIKLPVKKLPPVQAIVTNQANPELNPMPTATMPPAVPITPVLIAQALPALPIQAQRECEAILAAYAACEREESAIEATRATLAQERADSLLRARQHGYLQRRVNEIYTNFHYGTLNLDARVAQAKVARDAVEARAVALNGALEAGGGSFAIFASYEKSQAEYRARQLEAFNLKFAATIPPAALESAANLYAIVQNTPGSAVTLANVESMVAAMAVGLAPMGAAMPNKRD